MAAPESPPRQGAQNPLRVGQILVGKYRVERQIGRGGMGIVLAATHLQLEHLVAIKVLRRDLVEDDKALARLLLEARAAAKIRSEHVARVLDVGTLENGSPFIVMEYLEGEDLADLLDRQGALDVGQAVQFLLQSCEALAEVHAAEMVHRDLKPGNLFLAKLPDGSHSLKIVDFGISKHIGGSAHSQAATTSTQVLGSPYYMPPEQMRAEAVDERSDIWSLGAILFEMLTARPPFLGETLPEVYAGVLAHSAPSIESLRPGIPAGLDDIVQRCLDKDPAQRFCDVAELAEALAPFGGPASAQSVDRITRILTNPDLSRARASGAPKPEGMDFPSSGSTPRGGISVGPAMAGAPMIEVGEANAPSRVLAPLGSAEARRAASSSSDLGPLSATGSLADLEPPHSARRARIAWAALVLLALLVSVGLVLRNASEPSQPTAAPVPWAAAPYRDTAAASKDEASSPAPRAAADSLADGLPHAAAEAPALGTSRQALKPAPPARGPAISVEGFRAVVSKRAPGSEPGAAPGKNEKDKKATSRSVPVRVVPAAKGAPAVAPKESSARAEARGTVAPSAPAAAPNASSPRGAAGSGSRESDPWNPTTFGDRH